MIRNQRPTSYLIAVLACCIGLFAASAVRAQPVVIMKGNVSYTHTANTAVITVDQIDNISVLHGITTDLKLELWAMPTPYTSIFQAGYEQTGHLLASYRLGQLTQGLYFWQVNSGTIPFTPPPPGTWSITLLLTNYTGAPTNTSGGMPTDFLNFPAEVFTTMTPKLGLWSNPSETGTGYNIEYSDGAMVVTIFSYKPNGDSQWYLGVGHLTGTRFSATLDKYVAGPCLGCAYAGPPALVGNDGTMTIDFSSTTSATVTLPGGQVVPIQKFAF